MRVLGLRAKFVLVIGLTFLLIFGVIATILVRDTGNNLRNDLNSKSKLFADLATKPIGDTFMVYKDSGTARILEQTRHFTDLNSDITDVAVVDVAGRVQFSQNDKHAAVPAEQASSFNPVYGYDKDGFINQIITPFIEDTGAHKYNLVYSVSGANAQRIITKTERSIILFTLIGLVLSAVATYLLINWLFLRPIQKVSRQALIISAGNLAQQVSVSNSDEIGDLAGAVNKMSESLKADIIKLQETDKLKSEFMMISSHNLRTPLTIINGYLEEIMRSAPPPKLDEPLGLIAINVQRLNAFVEDILAITQLEGGNKLRSNETTKLASFLDKIVKEFKMLAEKKRLKFTVNMDVGAYQAQIGQAFLRSVIWNLLDNALKFTPNNGEIRLDVAVISSTVTIKISDTGAGIAPEEVPKLFTKFHRGTSTLEYKYEGTGIGLYATKLIIERHNGAVQVSSKLGQGSTFTVTLPVVN